MRLDSVSIQNFRVIKQATIPFPEKVIGIIGPNGAGKSSIIEAIAWALYGNNAARSSKEEIRATYSTKGESVEVDLSFTIHGEHYRVIRRLLGRNERPEVLLYRGGKSESVGSMETQKHIAHLLGLDWRGFLTSFLARQQELNALSDLPAGKRREHLAGMLGIDRLDQALAMAKDDTRQSHEKSAIIRQQLSEKDRLTERIGEISLEIVSHESARSEARGASDRAALLSTQLTQELALARDQREKCSLLEMELEAEHKTSHKNDQQLSQLKREHKELQAMIGEQAQLEKRLAKLPSITADLEREHERVNRKALSVEMARQLKETELDQDKLKKDQAENQSSRLEAQKVLSRIPAEIETDAKECNKRLEAALDQFSQGRANRELMTKEIKRISDQLGSINEIGPEAVCDRCQRPYGPDLEEVKRHLQHDLDQAETELAEKVKELTLLKAEGTKLRLEDQETQAQARLRSQTETDLKKLEIISRELGQKGDKLSKRQNELTARLDSLGEVAGDPERLQHLKDQARDLTELQRRSDQIGGRLKRLPELEKNIETMQLLEADTQKRLKDLKAQIDQLGFDTAKFEAAEKANSQALVDLEAQKQRLVEVSTKLDVARQELKLRSEQLESFKKLEFDLEEAVDSHYYGEKLQSLFGDFRKDLIARIRPRLASISSGLMAQMTGDRYNEIELDPDYNMKIMDIGQPFPIERFSGGEKDLANLCLRLAISLALTESAGLDHSFVILDEVFGSQDDERRDLIFKGLANLKEHFPQMILVTHVAEIKNKVEMLIEVERSSGSWSEVRVDGVVL